MSVWARCTFITICMLLIGLVLTDTALTAKDGRNERKAENIPTPREGVEKVEILYFHPRFRCLSCNNVEKYARQVVENEFYKEVKKGKIVFKSLNISDPENKTLVDELGVTGSSLYILVDGHRSKKHREIKSVWFQWNDSKKCKDIIASEINSALYGKRGSKGELPLASVPVVLAAFLLGLLTAISPCPLATNIAALSYVSKRLDNRRYTILASVLYTAGRMLAYTLIGLLLILIGLSASGISLFFQNYADKILGPLLIFFGLVMLDIIKFSIFKGRFTATIQEKIGDWGLVSSFLLGILFALAFCTYSAILFFGMLIPIALDRGGGIVLPAIYGFGTGLPLMIFAIALSLGISEIGKHLARVQKFEKYFRWFAGIVFIGVGAYYLLSWIKSLFY